MKNLQLFGKSTLSVDQMKKISGGQEQNVLLDCVNANGSTTTVVVAWPAGDRQIAEALDDFNANSGLSPIVGCEAP